MKMGKQKRLNLKRNIVKGKEEELKAKTETFSDVLWGETKETKHQKRRRNKISKSRGEEQQRHGDEERETNEQTRRDPSIL